MSRFLLLSLILLISSPVEASWFTKKYATSNEATSACLKKIAHIRTFMVGRLYCYTNVEEQEVEARGVWEEYNSSSGGRSSIMERFPYKRY